MGAVIRGVTDDFIELRKEVDRVFRHLNIDRRRELRAHAAHALTGRAFALVRFALQHQHVRATLLRQMISDTRSDDAAADDADVCSFGHGSESFAQRRSDRKSKRRDLLALGLFICRRYDVTSTMK